ncbi:MBL fold metallo-hydrolase [Thermodesulfobacteriota bacterium]
MLAEKAEILSRGAENGNGMAFRLRFPSGLEVLGLPTKNSYGGDWDLGPTWNYLVLADVPFLVDTGRTGTGKMLKDMMDLAGFRANDLEFIILTHGHEDHDGGLAELTAKTGTRIKAHNIYNRLIRFYPDHTPRGMRVDFPPSCWHCFMPEEFSKQNCVSYHRARNELEIIEVDNGETTLLENIECFYLPGHSPDALSIILGTEAVLLGDTILPEITPAPTRKASYNHVKNILKTDKDSFYNPYGLETYIRSIKRLKVLGRNFPEILPLPGHRLYNCGRWNEFRLDERIDELLQHHLDRCGDILRILKAGPKTAREIAESHFERNLLKGFGIFMAENEILSHCEILEESGDIVLSKDELFEPTGTHGFQSLISSLKPLGIEN